MDCTDVQSCVIECIGNEFIIRLCVLHGNTGLTVDLSDKTYQIIHFCGGVTHLKKGAATTSPNWHMIATILLPFDMSIPTVFIALLQSFVFATDVHPFTHCRFNLLGNVSLCWFNLPKPNAAIRGWLTVFVRMFKSKGGAVRSFAPLVA